MFSPCQPPPRFPHMPPFRGVCLFLFSGIRFLIATGLPGFAGRAGDDAWRALRIALVSANRCKRRKHEPQPLKKKTVFFLKKANGSHTRPQSLLSPYATHILPTPFSPHHSPPIHHRHLSLYIYIYIYMYRLSELGLGCRCGMTTGKMFCGEAGCKERAEYTLHGRLVNLAARLMSRSPFSHSHPCLTHMPHAQFFIYMSPACFFWRGLCVFLTRPVFCVFLLMSHAHTLYSSTALFWRSCAFSLTHPLSPCVISKSPTPLFPICGDPISPICQK